MTLKTSMQLWLITVALVMCQDVKAGQFNESFESVNQLTDNGWIFENRSDFAGDLSWSQGNASLFPAQAGPANSYILGGVGQTGGAILCDWLILPDIGFVEQLNFYTRTISNSTAADRLVVVHSPSGGTNTGPCINPIITKGLAYDFGDFSPLLFVNENLNIGRYPEQWTEFNVPVNAAGRLALVYFVDNVGQPPFNGNLIAIDSVSSGPSGPGPGPAVRSVPSLNLYALLLLIGLILYATTYPAIRKKQSS